MTYSSTELLFQEHYIFIKTGQNYISCVKYAQLGSNFLGCGGVDHVFVTCILDQTTLNFLDYPEDGSSKLLRNVRNITINTASYPRIHQQCYENQVQHYTELMWKIMGLIVRRHILFM